MTAPFQIEAMGPQHREAWLRFFDHEAFADNPRWAGCYCQYPSTDHAAVVWKEQTAELNRERACQRIASGRQRSTARSGGAGPGPGGGLVPRRPVD